MNKASVARRLDLVGSSSGSIVSVATWCALHAHDADVIVSCIDDKMRADTTSDGTRASLLYVLHELLLTCASRGTSESGKRAVLVAVSRTLLGTVDAILQKPHAEKTAFVLALEKVAGWWVILHILPKPWMTDLQRKLDVAQKELGLAGSVPGALQLVTSLMGRYSDAKEQWLQSQRKHSDSGMTTSDAAASETAMRCLIALRKAAAGRLEGGASIVEWCDAERAVLEGRSWAVKQEPSGIAESVPVGRTVSGNDKSVIESDDILGSFF